MAWRVWHRRLAELRLCTLGQAAVLRLFQLEARTQALGSIALPGKAAPVPLFPRHSSTETC